VILTVTANPALDLTYRLEDADHLGDRAVEVHRARSVSLEASGKGVNVSRALTLAGRPNTAALLVGGQTGQQLLDLLSADKVAHRAVRQSGPTRVNTTILTAGGPTTKVNAPGTGPSPEVVDNLVIAVDNEMATLSDDGAVHRAGADWLLICGSMPPGTKVEALTGRLVESAHARNWRVAVDSSGDGLKAGFTAGADLLAPNAAELSAVLGTTVLAGRELFTAAASSAAEHGCELLISLGADGALWTDGRRTLHVRGPVITPINSAGAGDALLAGWFFTDPGDDPVYRLRTAVAWGTAACLSPTTVAIGGAGAIGDCVLISDLLEAP